MSAPDPIDFGVRAMAAALNLTDEGFRAAYRCGEVIAPDRVRQREPRWSVPSLVVEIKKRVPISCEPVLWGLRALIRAERQEGWHDEP